MLQKLVTISSDMWVSISYFDHGHIICFDQILRYGESQTPQVFNFVGIYFLNFVIF